MRERGDDSDVITQQYAYGNYLDDRRGGITVGDLNDGTGSDRHFYHCRSLHTTYLDGVDYCDSIIGMRDRIEFVRINGFHDPGTDGFFDPLLKSSKVAAEVINRGHLDASTCV